MEFQTGVIYLEGRFNGGLFALPVCIEGLIFEGAYFRNFTVCDERSSLNRRNTTVPNRRVGENPGNEDSEPRFKIWRMGLI